MPRPCVAKRAYFAFVRATTRGMTPCGGRFARRNCVIGPVWPFGFGNGVPALRLPINEPCRDPPCRKTGRPRAWSASYEGLIFLSWHFQRERYVYLAPDHLASAAKRLDSLLGGYDVATPEKAKGRAPDQLMLLVGPAEFEPATKGL